MHYGSLFLKKILALFSEAHSNYILIKNIDKKQICTFKYFVISKLATTVFVSRLVFRLWDIKIQIYFCKKEIQFSLKHEFPSRWGRVSIFMSDNETVITKIKLQVKYARTRCIHWYIGMCRWEWMSEALRRPRNESEIEGAALECRGRSFASSRSAPLTMPRLRREVTWLTGTNNSHVAVTE